MVSRPPTLLIVMGTSGSGKSTVGSALSSALSCPFIDGDDLHPESNVAKMSAGHPLDDADREPWLKTIRKTGLDVALTQRIPASLQKEESGSKKLAEVYETSAQQTTHTDARAAAQQSTQEKKEEMQGSSEHLAIIACSSLKLVYRRLLRGTITSLDDPAATKPESEAGEPTDLRVVHVYLELSKELLEERMANRKGHFMKLDMLYSQLATLQVPEEDKEPGVVKVKVEHGMTTEQIIEMIVDKLKANNIV